MIDSLKVLYVEDDADLGRQVAEAIEDGDFGNASVQVISDFTAAREDVENRRYDLLILDVYVGKPGPEGVPAGLDIQAHLSQVRFVPTIFYTALPEAVSGTDSPFIRVIGKGRDGLVPLLIAVKDFVSTGLIELNRGISALTDRAYLDYMDQFVGKHWQEFAKASDRRALAYLVSRHLARSLASDAVDHLAEMLGAAGSSKHISANSEEDLIHRMQYYVMPPVYHDFLTGDIVHSTIGERTGYWVILTPSCDMVTGRKSVKAEYVQLAATLPLIDFEEYRQWVAKSTEPSKKTLVALMSNNRQQGQASRYHYLPGVFDLPHLVVDFQQVTHLSHDHLTSMRESGALHRISSLDSPYAEALLNRYIQYMMRVGTPVLDMIEALESAQHARAE